ncbi:uncharacterized protein SPAPADRAFT_50613 [Spathaspora passalidarum NRRL Y-27907]|uniref:NAD(P)-binding domain-containing protein n=1 Tax=Spathaspora passalidarum (strain NRRL Y-27907 / 11-Y1) TaxID=619300 RepID=G3ANS5_SPAPN|nr:uncharacterized protein SPAPADRAFT_50613 [Spathaspora passalidarum NRRL Y-27907]EGW32010.1 hypothetical protein SPAPADRAFT_50613 [Spathaspora passalidarum NRRL Y-27907]
MSAFILGSTGLIGGQIVRYLANSPTYKTLYPITRRDDFRLDSRITNLVDKNPDNWPDFISSHPEVTTLISALGTREVSRNSRKAKVLNKVDYGINYSIARVAKENGVKTLILISRENANPYSLSDFVRTKGELERDLKNLGFEHTVIIRVRMVFPRKEGQIGWQNTLGEWLSRMSRNPLVLRSGNYPCMDVDVARIVVDFAEKAESGQLENRVTVVEPWEIVDMADQLIDTAEKLADIPEDLSSIS